MTAQIVRLRWRYYAGIGARDTPAEVLDRMTAVARWQRERGRVLRSGAAPGADSAFELGAGYLSEIWVPWRKFPYRDIADADPFYHVLQDASWRSHLEQLAQQYHTGWARLTVAARSLMVRDMAQIYGASPSEPVSEYVIAYALPDRDRMWAGGTGQALRLAHAVGVPIVNFWTPQGPLSYEEVLDKIADIEARNAA